MDLLNSLTKADQLIAICDLIGLFVIGCLWFQMRKCNDKIK